jgi:sulfate adenylyltransferase subunit 1 (EFTu-like GTPase family)
VIGSRRSRPQSITLCLADDVDVARGDLLAHPNNVPRVERSVEAMVVWMADAPLLPGGAYLLKHTHAARQGHV